MKRIRWWEILSVFLFLCVMGYLGATFLEQHVIVSPQFAEAQDARQPVKLQKITGASWAFAQADTTKDYTLTSDYNTQDNKSTESHSIKLILPNWASNATATFSIKDTAASTIYSIASLAENTTHYLQLSRPLEAGCTYTILLSTTAGTGGGTATGITWVYK